MPYQEYKGTLEAIDEALMMLDDNLDDDFRELVKEELAENKKRVEPLQNELKLLLLPKDPNDEKNVIMEIRGGAGGDEAEQAKNRLAAAAEDNKARNDQAKIELERQQMQADLYNQAADRAETAVPGYLCTKYDT